MPHLEGMSMVLAFFFVVGAQWWMGGWLSVLRREEFQVAPRPGVSTLRDHGISYCYIALYCTVTLFIKGWRASISEHSHVIMHTVQFLWVSMVKCT